MAEIIVFQSGVEKSDRGTYEYMGMRLKAKETVRAWKMNTTEQSVKVVMEWSKKDFPSFEQWENELAKTGFKKVIE